MCHLIHFKDKAAHFTRLHRLIGGLFISAFADRVPESRPSKEVEGSLHTELSPDITDLYH
jgi:hypothetical protein